MGHGEDTILSLSLGSCVPPTIRTRHPQNPISLDASLALSVSSDGVVPTTTTTKAAPLQSSSHSTVSTLISTACRVKREKDDRDRIGGEEEVEVERGSSSRASDEDIDDGSVRKKLRLTKEQSALLEERFKEHSTLNPKQKQALAKRLNLRQRQVEVWFQNRRARTKLKQTEADYELLKRCYETLTGENRRLQKEVNELKAVKYVAAPLYMQLPAAALTVCPSCERVTGPEVGDSGANGGGGVGAPKTHFFNPFTRSAAC